MNKAVQEISTIFHQAFKEHELESFVRSDLGHNLSGTLPQDGFSNTIEVLVGLAEREGWLRELVVAFDGSLRRSQLGNSEIQIMRTKLEEIYNSLPGDPTTDAPPPPPKDKD